MPIDDHAQVVIALRLQTAYAEMHESYARKPAWVEILTDVALAQQWLAIGAAYSGIEQTLKFPHRARKGPHGRRTARQERHRRQP